MHQGPEWRISDMGADEPEVMARPARLPEPWHSLALALGSQEGSPQAIAEAIPCPLRTLYNWIQGIRKPNATARAAILWLFEAQGIEPPSSI